MNFYEIMISAVFLWFVVKDAINHRRTDKLLNRIMAKNYEEYKYYEEKYPTDLRELETIRAETHVEKGATGMVEQDLFEDDKMDITQFEEDWAPEELDETRMKPRNE